MSVDERKEADKREEEARVWISGLEHVKEKIDREMALTGPCGFPRFLHCPLRRLRSGIV